MAVKQALYCYGWLSPCIHTVDDALIDFFNGWSTSGSASRVTTSGTRYVWHTAWHTTTSTLVHLGDDWCADFFQFLLSVLEFVLFSGLVVVQPLDGFVTSITNGLDFIGGDLVLDLVVFNSLFHLEGV